MRMCVCLTCIGNPRMCLACALQWQLCVWKGHWISGFYSWMYAVVVIGAVVITALVFTVLLSW